MISISYSRALAVLAVGMSLAIAVCAVVAGSAHAAMLPAQQLKLSSGSIVELNDIAISEDGTGGAVFVVLESGKKHVYAALFRNGSWGEPLRVDNNMLYDAFEPRIGAGDGGRVVVTFIERGPSSPSTSAFDDQLYSASIDAGGAQFEDPIPIDLHVGPEQFVSASVSINRVGIGYIIYRTTSVADQPNNGDTPQSKVRVRLARYNGWTWSRLDQDVNRDIATKMDYPTESNAPKVVADQFGNAVVAWQEPDQDALYPRIYMRRVFGGLMGLPMLASPQTWNDQPLRGTADSISLDGGALGNAVVSFRQSPGNPPTLDRTRVMTNSLTAKTYADAGQLQGVVLADTLDAGPPVAPRTATVQISTEQKTELVYSYDGSAVRAIFGPNVGASIAAVGEDGGIDDAALGLNLGDDGNAAVARVVGPSESQAVSIAEETVGGVNAAAFAAEDGRAVADLKFTGNRSGDAALIFRQLNGAGESVLMAGGIDSPPDVFMNNAKEGWDRAKQPKIEWKPSYDAFGGTRYEVRVDGVLAGATLANDLLLPKSIREGRHSVQVVALDRLGQGFASEPAPLNLDRTRPRIRLKKLGRKRVSVSVSDGTKRKSSGASRRSRITWGDGKKSRLYRKKSHTFKHSGKVIVRVVARDRAGNKRTFKVRLKI